MSTVLIAGGTGLIGSRLSHLLKEQGHEVRHLSRSSKPNAAYPTFRWDLKESFLDEAALAGSDYVINLAGAGIADKPWTKARKQLIIDSRVQSNALLHQSIQKTGHQPKAYISASAIGFYGDTGDQFVDETSPAGQGFLSESCVEWENSLRPIASSVNRLVTIRIGIVLSTVGGALEKMLMTTGVRVSSYFGDGQQYYSWIHIDDLCRIFIQAIEDEKMEGIYNGVAPNPVTNKTMAKDIATASGKGMLVLPAPAFALRLGMGEMADVVLTSTRVSAAKIEHRGFKFHYSTLVPALKHLMQEKT